MLRGLLVATWLIARAVLADPIPSTVGKVDAQFQVDSGGGAIYEVPLKVPPGTAGLEPGLSLSYGSLQANGMAGVGWNLNGLSSISRCAATQAQDGFRSAINYDAKDRFCLDGQRLVAFGKTDGTIFTTDVERSAAYGLDGTTYRTEKETWTMVVSNGVCGSGPCQFTVRRKNGQALQFAQTTDSRVLALGKNGSVRSWMMNRLEDRNHNYLTVAYSADPLNDGSSVGAVYPSRIDYSANDASVPRLVARRSVTFTYEARPDAVEVYSPGSRIRIAARLSRISTFVDQQSVKQYFISYQVQSGRSFPLRLFECDGAGNCLPPTVFQWGQDLALQVLGYSAAPLPAVKSRRENATLLQADFNGDGLVDIVMQSSTDAGCGSSEAGVYLSTGSGVAPVLCLGVKANRNTATLLVGDLNGDGRADLIVQANAGSGLCPAGQTALYLSKGDGVEPLKCLAITANRVTTTISLADFNGDNIDDVIVQGTGNACSGTLALYLAAGAGDVQPVRCLNVPANPNTTTSISGDFNGDGRTDFLVQSGASVRPCKTEQLMLYISTGTDVEDVRCVNVLAPRGVSTVVAGDFNGDQLTDLAVFNVESGACQGKTAVYFSTGVDFLVPQCLDAAVNLTNVSAFASDVNGDGLADIVVQQGYQQTMCPSGQIGIILSTGSGFAPVQCLPIDANKDIRTLLVGDLDGDGRMDLIVQTTQATPTCPAGATCLYRQDPNSPASQATARHDALLTMVTNGLGGTLTFAYKPLSDPATYSKGTLPSYPYQAVQNDLMVVSSATKGDGRGQFYSTDYGYVGAQRDLEGRGWRGFAQVTATKRETLLQTVRQLNQDFPYTGSLIRAFTSCSSGNTFDPRCNQPVTLLSAREIGMGPQGYVCRDVTTGGPCSTGTPSAPTRIYFVAQSRRQESVYDYGRALFSTLKTYDYDGYGNVARESDLGDPGNAGDDFYTCSTYQPDVANWQLDLEATRVVASDAGCTTVLRRTTYGYTDGNLTSKAMHDDSVDPPRTITTGYGYDPFGNVISVTLPAGAQLTRFDTDFQTYPIENSWPPNAQGQVISENMVVDPRFGMTVVYADPNGNARLTCLDGFGRTVAEQAPAPPDTTPDAPCVQGAVGRPVVTVRTQTFGSDSLGTYTEIRERADWTVRDAAQWSWSREYSDGLDRIVHSTSAGLDSARPVQVDVTFDAQGLIGRETLPAAVGEPILATIHGYDITGRPIRRVDPDRVVTTIAYSGSAQGTTADVIVAPGSGQRRTVKQYDVRSALARVDFYRDDGSYFSTILGRDRLSRLVSAWTGPVGLTQDWDSLDRITRTTTADKGTTRYLYDDTGLLGRQLNPDGQAVEFRYDSLRRPIEASTTDGGKTTHVFDDPAMANARGRLSKAQAQDAAGSTTEVLYEYDVQGNVARRTATIRDKSFVTTHTYDPRGQPATLTFPDGVTQRTDYYTNGRLRAQSLLGTFQGDFPDIVSFNDYTGAGSVKDVNYRGHASVSAKYSYDPATALLARHVVTGPAGTLLDDEYQWDNQGRIVAIGDQLKAGGIDRSRAFTYTALGRLNTAKGPYGDKSFQFADDGSVVLKDDVSYTNIADQVSTGSVGEQQTYAAAFDANGNLTKQESQGRSWTYAFDAEGNLLSAADSRGGINRFAYDHVGRRVLRIDAQEIASYYPLPALKLTAPPTGPPQATYFVDGVVHEAVAVTTGSPGTAMPPSVSFLHQDYLGTTSLVTDGNGSVQARLVYLPFGELDPKSSSGQERVDLRFGGFTWDSETSLYYDSARYYDPQLARFLSPDPDLGRNPVYASAYNRYAYANDDPVNMIDPDGRWEIPILSQLMDVGFIAYDVFRLVTQPSAANAAFLAADIGAAIAPGLPDGSGQGMRVGQFAADVAATAARSVQDSTRAALDSAGAEARHAAEGAHAEAGAADHEAYMDEENAGHDSCFSFVAGTRVATAEGAQPIEYLRLGDQVLSYDEARREDAFNPIEGTRMRRVSSVVVIATAGERIEATPEHPFYADAGSGWAWVPAAQLKAGDRLKTVDGAVIVEQVESRQKEVAVYNFAVALASNYYVSNAKVLVHNAKFCQPKRSKRLNAKKIQEREQMQNPEKRQGRGVSFFGRGDGIFEPGAHANGSIPARGPGRNFTVVERRAINKIGRNYGCHRCGIKIASFRRPETQFVPDHQPPSALNDHHVKQRLYPHCRACSSKQGGAVAGELVKRRAIRALRGD